jgi:hypothetical protein
MHCKLWWEKNPAVHTVHVVDLQDCHEQAVLHTLHVPVLIRSEGCW